MKKRWLLVPLVCMILFFPAVGQMTLSLTERAVEKKYPVPNITHDQLQKHLESAPREWVLFDTRKLEEFRVGHLKGAIHVEPEMDAAAFMKTHGRLLKQKDVVFYCSVGYRSSIFLERVSRLAKEAGARSVYNLRGGIFRWYNENHRVYNHSGETDDIHPYDGVWGALVVKRKN